MRINLQYGEQGLPVELPAANIRVIEPVFVEGLAHEEAGFRAAVRAPIAVLPEGPMTIPYLAGAAS